MNLDEFVQQLRKLGQMCTSCGAIKPFTSFPKDNRKGRGYRSWCKECYAEKTSLRRYGLSKPEFLRLLQSQNFSCAICQGVFHEENRPFIDHDHNSNKVRGLLCNHCNLALGLLERLEWLSAAKKYLGREF